MTLFHLHIPKTAGGSVLAIMRSQYGSGLLAVPARGWRDVVPSTAQQAQAISGHIPHGVPQREWAIDGVRTFTFLRDPVKRAASLYSYIKMRGRAHHAYEFVSTMAAQEFAEAGPFDNCQTRMLAGRPDFQWFEDKDPVTESDLETAYENLQRLWFVGNVATFRDDIYQLADELGWRGFVIPHVNASYSKPHIETTPAFRDKWCWDLALYERYAV